MLKRVGYAFGPSTLIVGTGLVLHAQPTYESLGAVLGLAAGVALWKGLTQKWPMLLAAGGGLVALSSTTWLGMSVETSVAWLLASAGGLGARLWHEHETGLKAIDKQIKYTRLQIQQVRLEDVIAARRAAAYVPNLKDLTPEGTAIRGAIWELFKQELPGLVVEQRPTGFKAVLILPPQLDRDTLKSKWNKVEGALGLSGRWSLRDGDAGNELVVMYAVGSVFPDLVAYQPPQAEKLADPIYLGPDADGADTFLTVAGRHTLVLGTSGNGKSVITNQIIFGLVRRGVAVIGVDMKRGVELSPVAPLLVTVAKDGDSAREVFDWIDGEVDRRAEIMIREGVTNWSEEFGPYIAVILDELSELTDAKWKVEGLPDLAKLVASGSRVWRAFGIYQIAATQAPSRHAFGGSTDARTNYKNRLGTRVMEAAHAQYGFGADWKSNGWNLNQALSAPGEYMLANDEYKVPIARKAPFLTDDQRADEVGRLIEYRVGLDGSPWGSGGVPLTIDTRVLNLLRNRADITRQEIEQGLGLDRKQVLNAIDRLRRRKSIEIGYNSEDNSYWLGQDGTRTLVARLEATGTAP